MQEILESIFYLESKSVLKILQSTQPVVFLLIENPSSILLHAPLEHLMSRALLNFRHLALFQFRYRSDRQSEKENNMHPGTNKSNCTVDCKYQGLKMHVVIKLPSLWDSWRRKQSRDFRAKKGLQT